MGQEDDPAELSLRLRNRAATLLADPHDKAARIFDDLSIIYELRSRVMHGSRQDPKKLIARIEKVPAAALRTLPGTKTEFLIDRFRDLVRRAILARLFLAQGESPAWPLGGAKDLDKRLTDDQERQQLRNLWRERVRSLVCQEPLDRLHKQAHGTNPPRVRINRRTPLPLPSTRAR